MDVTIRLAALRICYKLVVMHNICRILAQLLSMLGIISSLKPPQTDVDTPPDQSPDEIMHVNMACTNLFQ
jgi:hypothetical protein